MAIDLDRAVAVAEVQQRALPWELKVLVGGEERAVKPLSNSDIAYLGTISSVGGDEKARKFVLGLLEPRPASLSDEQIAAVIVTIGEFLTDHLKKKSLALARAVLAEMRLASASSSPPSATSAPP